MNFDNNFSLIIVTTNLYSKDILKIVMIISLDIEHFLVKGKGRVHYLERPSLYLERPSLYLVPLPLFGAPLPLFGAPLPLFGAPLP